MKIPDYHHFFTSPSLQNTQVIEIGTLHVTTGKLFCCDPFLSEEVNAFERTVPPGEYPVKLCIINMVDWGKRVALATMMISNNLPKSWEEATYSVNGIQHSGFPVDAGLACFMDQHTQIKFNEAFDLFYQNHPEGNYYDDQLAQEFALNAEPSNPRSCGDWNIHYPNKHEPSNIAMFASGLGDGVYRAYWGLDNQQQPCMLVVDFQIVS